MPRAEANKKRLIIATFASNISRVQQIINCAEKYGRKVALSGRSMVNVMSIASELGYLKVPDGLLIDLNMISRYTKEQIVLITTGSKASRCLHLPVWRLPTTVRSRSVRTT